jgi:hypothetical protein
MKVVLVSEIKFVYLCKGSKNRFSETLPIDLHLGLRARCHIALSHWELHLYLRLGLYSMLYHKHKMLI